MFQTFWWSLSSFREGTPYSHRLDLLLDSLLIFAYQPGFSQLSLELLSSEWNPVFPSMRISMIDPQVFFDCWLSLLAEIALSFWSVGWHIFDRDGIHTVIFFYLRHFLLLSVNVFYYNNWTTNWKPLFPAFHAHWTSKWAPRCMWSPSELNLSSISTSFCTWPEEWMICQSTTAHKFLQLGLEWTFLC